VQELVVTMRCERGPGLSRQVHHEVQPRADGVPVRAGGFTKEAHEDVRSNKAGTVLIILVDADDLERWIAADDRLAVLRELHARAVFDLQR
jgi:hypothetical protein